jgi:hypothetical protein
MFKGILIALILMWFTIGAQARIANTQKNPYAGLEKAISKMSKKEKIKTLETIYEFMMKREDYQTTPIVVFNKEPVPDWLNTLLWETSNAGAIADGHAEISSCLSHGAVRSNCPRQGAAGYDPKCVPNVYYPNSCMYAGNIICTQSVPPKCNKDFIAKEKPSLICDGGDIKCNPDLFMQCNGDQVSSHDCVDPKKAEPNGTKGPKITKACITEHGSKTMEQKATAVAACADFSEGGRVAKALEEISKFCSALTSRAERGQFRKDFAGNDQDCEDMLKFIATVQGKKPPPVVVVAPTPEAPPEEPCKDYPTLCEGQDVAGACGSYIYTPDAKQNKECINVTVTQAGNPSFKETPKVCNDAVKDNSEEGRARQIGWLHRPYRPFNWNDDTMIGRAATGSSDGNPNRPDAVKNGRVTAYKDKYKEGLTNKRGYADLCWDSESGVYRPSDYFMTYLDKTVKNPAQNTAVKTKFMECADRNRREMAKQGLNLHSGLTVEQAADRYDRAKNIWAMIRVKDVTNTHMAVKKTTGVAMTDASGRPILDSRGNASPICDPSSPCTEGTFVCAKTNNKMEIKDKVAEYVTIYSDRQKSGEYGKTQYVETGTYQTWDYDEKNGRVKREDDGTPKMKFKHYPVNAQIWDADENDPFLQISRPVEIKNEWWKGLFKAKQSVMYSAIESTCPWGDTGDPNSHNKVVARKNESGEIDSGVFICDSSDAQNYSPWMWTNEPPKLEKNADGQAALKDMKLFNKKTGAEESLSLTFNANSVGTCILKDSNNKLVALLPERRIITSKGSIRDNSRGIQSEGKPIVVEEPKK